MSNPVGRPSVMTQETIDKLEEAFSWGCTDIEACLNADIDKSTLYKYQQAHPEFIDRKETLKSNPIRKARLSVVNKLEDDPRLAMEFLKNKKSDEFNTKKTIDADVNVRSVDEYLSLIDEGELNDFDDVIDEIY